MKKYPCKCGSTAGIMMRFQNGDTEYMAICQKCFTHTAWVLTREEAIDRWNRREYV